MGDDEEPTGTAKQNRRVLLRPKAFQQLQRLADRDESEVAELVNRACRDLLAKEGFWPPPLDPPQPAPS